MARYITLDEAKDQLNIPAEDVSRDHDILRKAELASTILEGHVTDSTKTTWTETTAPLPIKAATLYLLVQMYESRGDDMKTAADTWAAIDRILYGCGYRDLVFK